MTVLKVVAADSLLSAVARRADRALSVALSAEGLRPSIWDNTEALPNILHQPHRIDVHTWNLMPLWYEV